MAGKIIADTQEHSTAGSIATNYVVNGSAKAKVSYNGSSSTIRSSFNTSSVSDVATGRYYWANTNAFTDTNTGILSGATHRTGVQSLSGISGRVQATTTQWDLNTVNNAASSADAELGALGTGDLA